MELVKAAFYGDCSDHDVGIAQKNVIPINAIAPFIWECASLDNWKSIPRTFIRCVDDKAIPIDAQDAMLGASTGVKSHTLNSSHSSFLSHPDDLTRILLSEI